MVKRGNDYYLNGLGKAVRTAEPNGKTMATDIDENNLTFGSKERMVKKTTMERPIRTAYFLKRRQLLSKPRLYEKPLIQNVRA
ncbi:MAG: hypothetical protein QXO55_07050 [Candidatus Korarchaeum sp.]